MSKSKFLRSGIVEPSIEPHGKWELIGIEAYCIESEVAVSPLAD